MVSPGVGNIKTTTPVSSLSANLQAALPITLGAGAGGLADGLEADLAYMSFPKKRRVILATKCRQLIRLQEHSYPLDS